MAKVKVVPRISSVELPVGWTDETKYEFSSSDQELTLAISREEFEPQETMDAILTSRQERFEDVGPVDLLEKTELKVDGQEAGLLKMAVDPEEGAPTHLAYLLVIRFSPEDALGALMYGPKSLQQRMEEAWSIFTDKLTFETP